MSMNEQNRKLLCTDESRMWFLKLVGTTVQAIHSLMFAYLFYIPISELSFKITTSFMPFKKRSYKHKKHISKEK